MQTNIGADIFRAGGTGSVAGVEIDNVQVRGGRIGVDKYRQEVFPSLNLTVLCSHPTLAIGRPRIVFK